ncbi:hypothetical protein J3R83DRAFT_8076 [Lanmaoa asiatica]|nr:hypothetical protein J3R83DRAFT_8076 [Lanmaoa asiatica]
MITDFWLVHRGKVDVPAMYDPNGRYRYTGGFNWRAVLAMSVTVVPMLPGLVNSISPAITVGYTSHLFDVAWMYGFVVSSVVYYATSVLFPARKTFVEKLISADDAGVDYDHGSDDKSPTDTFSGKGEDLEK